MTYSDLPTINATLNCISAILLIFGYRFIKRGHRSAHQKCMIAALSVSALFLISYVIYHAEVGSIPYPYHDWTRPVYFVILIPHVILAAVMVPFVLTTVWLAWREKFSTHRRLARIVWPVWFFVSISGVVIYMMLYRL